METTKLKVVKFTNPQEFLKAIDMNKNDTSFLNFSLGPIMDSLDDAHIAVRGPDVTSRIMLGVYEGEELVVILSRVKANFAWILNSLRDVRSLNEAFVSEVASLLARYLPTTIEPQTLDFVLGDDALSEALIHAYGVELNSRGIPVKVPPPLFRGKISYATKATIPPSLSTFSQYPVQLAHTPEDLDVLADMYGELNAAIGPKPPIEECKKEIGAWLSLGLLWLCYVDNKPAGYVAVARSTPRTIAIRDVYVKPEFRRRGIAETLVRAVTRYYLGAEPAAVGGSPTASPKEGFKQEIVLNVIDEHVARLYRRCGFLLGDEDRDPDRGRGGWVPSSFWTIEKLTGLKEHVV